MKRQTSIRNAKSVAAAIKKCNGIIGTPEAVYDAFKIKAAWVFGSTIKGKENPNDTDILIEAYSVGRCRYHNAKRSKARSFYKMDSTEAALRHLRGSMKMVRFHFEKIDGSIAYPRVMIYPRMDLKEQA